MNFSPSPILPEVIIIEPDNFADKRDISWRPIIKRNSPVEELGKHFRIERKG